MEAYWSETIDKGIQAASKLKKFQNRFAQSGDGPGQHLDRIENRRSVTLSNKPSAAPSPQVQPAPSRKLTWDERTAEILKRFA
jgi:hypothetical protein